MRSKPLVPIGRAIKKRLIDLDKNQLWLVGQVKQATGLYFDSAYLQKIMTGTLKTPGVVSAIREILDISEDADP
jgi:hypothetical protein